ncbi:MAG: S-layer homology domain-containing protein [Gemmatimonadota bacterium]|nr:S-layer homology domain-containing protein [Gemmatimonadota bacterium]
MRRLPILAVLATGVLAMAGASLAQLPPGGTFSDDNGNVHEGFIEAIAAEGITTGCDTSLYCPSDDVTRGQMASFLARALDLPAAMQDWFPDDTGLVHEDNINRIADAGITTGFNDGTYRPAEFVRRDQMGSFLARGLVLPSPTQDYFSDDAGLVHEDNINRIAEAGVTQGCDDGVYCPDDNVRRDQMASFLGRALGLTPIIPPAPTGTLFSGPLQSQPGFTGQISFELATGNDEVKNPALALQLDKYQCNGVTLSGDGVTTIFTTLPVINGSFSYSGLITWDGTLDSATTASGTISGTDLLGTSCDWGPLSWSASSTN